MHRPRLCGWLYPTLRSSFRLRAVSKNPRLIPVAIILGVALLVIAGVYFAEPAGSLPSFFPGHEAGSSHHHVKHGILAFVLAIGCFVFAWFQTGPASRPPAES
jgi:hypothetical protein